MGSTTPKAEKRKLSEYKSLRDRYIVQPVVVETMGVIGHTTLSFFLELGNRISTVKEDRRATSFLIQRIMLVVVLGIAFIIRHLCFTNRNLLSCIATSLREVTIYYELFLSTMMFNQFSILASSTSNTNNTSNNQKKQSTESNAEKDKPPGIVGLANLGNTCFINVTIQCLSLIDPLNQLLITYQQRLGRISRLGAPSRLSPSAVTESVSESKRLVQVLGQVLQSIWTGTFDSRIMLDFKKAVSSYHPEYDGHREHDAQEFLLYLLNALNDEIPSNPNNPSIKSSSRQSIQSLFAGIQRIRLECPNADCRKKEQLRLAKAIKRKKRQERLKRQSHLLQRSRLLFSRLVMMTRSPTNQSPSPSQSSIHHSTRSSMRSATGSTNRGDNGSIGSGCDQPCNEELFFCLSLPLPDPNESVGLSNVASSKPITIELIWIPRCASSSTEDKEFAGLINGGTGSESMNKLPLEYQMYRRLKLTIEPSDLLENVYAKLRRLLFASSSSSNNQPSASTNDPPKPAKDNWLELNTPLVLFETTETGFGSWYLETSESSANIPLTFSSISANGQSSSSLLPAQLPPSLYAVELSLRPTPPPSPQQEEEAPTTFAPTVVQDRLATNSSPPPYDNSFSTTTNGYHQSPVRVESTDSHVSHEHAHSTSSLFLSLPQHQEIEYIQLLLLHVSSPPRSPASNRTQQDATSVNNNTTTGELTSDARSLDGWRPFALPSSLLVPRAVEFEDLEDVIIEQLACQLGMCSADELKSLFPSSPSLTLWVVDAGPNEARLFSSQSGHTFPLLHPTIDLAIVPIDDPLIVGGSASLLLRLVVVWPSSTNQGGISLASCRRLLSSNNSLAAAPTAASTVPRDRAWSEARSNTVPVRKTSTAATAVSSMLIRSGRRGSTASSSSSSASSGLMGATSALVNGCSIDQLAHHLLASRLPWLWPPDLSSNGQIIDDDGPNSNGKARTKVARVWRTFTQRLTTTNRRRKRASIAAAAASSGGSTSATGSSKVSVTNNESLNLFDCFQTYIKAQELGDGNAWHCPSCCQPQPKATLRQCLIHLPDFLFLHLKRFYHQLDCDDDSPPPSESGQRNGRKSTFTRPSMRKITTMVNFPLRGLDLSSVIDQSAATVAGQTDSDCDDESGEDLDTDSIDYSPVTTANSSHLQLPSSNRRNRTVSCNTEASVGSGVSNKWLMRDDENRCLVYDLIAVCNHTGDLNSGHYTVSCLSPVDGKWRFFNDTAVSVIAEDQIVRPSAYLLLYKRRSRADQPIGPQLTNHWSYHSPSSQPQSPNSDLSSPQVEDQSLDAGDRWSTASPYKPTTTRLAAQDPTTSLRSPTSSSNITNHAGYSRPVYQQSPPPTSSTVYPHRFNFSTPTSYPHPVNRLAASPLALDAANEGPWQRSMTTVIIQRPPISEDQSQVSAGGGASSSIVYSLNRGSGRVEHRESPISGDGGHVSIRREY